MGITESTSKAQSVVATINLSLDTYAKTMDKDRDPGEIDGPNQQVNMLNVLRLIFRQEEEEVFNAAFKALLDWVAKNINNCMSHGPRYRYLHMAKKISSQDQSAILLIIGLACMVADKSARAQVIARFDFSRLDRIWVNGAGGDKLRNYFLSQ